jgi:hypothetical protein
VAIKEIQYILSNNYCSSPNNNINNNNSQELEDTLFNASKNLMVSSAINIRQSYNTFSQAERICELKNKSIDMSKNSYEIIGRNAANDFNQTLQESDELAINKL